MENLYRGLGLSDADISRLEKYNLSYLLDKIKDQQNQLENHKKQLETVLAKIEKDLSAARDAQMNLLPKDLIGVPEVEFSARFYPSQYVSGDIYNIFRLDEAHIGVYHIDISGHGIPAALFSVSLSQMLNTNISSRNLLKVPVKVPPYYKLNPPDKVIAILDEDHSFKQSGIYFTMIYMIINIRDRLIRYTRAGHNPPIIIRANGDVIVPESGGFPVGWNIPRNDEVKELHIFPGDRLFMYSDGITEAANSKEQMYSLKRLTDKLLANHLKSLEESLDAIINDLQDFSGRDTFEDDVSIIGLSWNK